MASKQFPLFADSSRKAERRKMDGFTLSLVGTDIAVFPRTRESIAEGEG
jgi:hypothetical protein